MENNLIVNKLEFQRHLRYFSEQKGRINFSVMITRDFPLFRKSEALYRNFYGKDYLWINVKDDVNNLFENDYLKISLDKDTLFYFLLNGLQEDIREHQEKDSKYHDFFVRKRFWTGQNWWIGKGKIPFWVECDIYESKTIDCLLVHRKYILSFDIPNFNDWVDTTGKRIKKLNYILNKI